MIFNKVIAFFSYKLSLLINPSFQVPDRDTQQQQNETCIGVKKEEDSIDATSRSDKHETKASLKTKFEVYEQDVSKSTLISFLINK